MLIGIDFCWLSLMLSAIYTVTYTRGACEFKQSWMGKWFQSGVQHLLHINATTIETKGRCLEEDGDKYLLYNSADNCYRCMVINEKHPSILQYKENNCDSTTSTLRDTCELIGGDAALYTLVRKSPEAKPVACPFKGGPFTFRYNRGAGECSNPPSKAESCTDESRLVLKYQACVDVQSTEGAVEELICLATWKDGSHRYLFGRIVQKNHHLNAHSDEAQLRCFLYKRTMDHTGRTVEYRMTQSGDATCNGLNSIDDGNPSITLTTTDNHHSRCKFPGWITEHHTWTTLNHGRVYKFSQRNATLRINTDESGSRRISSVLRPPEVALGHGYSAAGGGYYQQQQMPPPQPPQAVVYDQKPMRTNTNNINNIHRNEEEEEEVAMAAEMRVICHSEVVKGAGPATTTTTNAWMGKHFQIVAHVTAGCNSGYICMVFHRRDTHIIEIQQSDHMADSPDGVCSNFNATYPTPITLLTVNLPTKNCPNFGRFTVLNGGGSERRSHLDGAEDNNVNCNSYDSMAFACSANHQVDMFRRNCSHQPENSFICHGHWLDDSSGIYYGVTSPRVRRSNEPQRYCFVYQLDNGNTDGGSGKSDRRQLSPETTIPPNVVVKAAHARHSPSQYASSSAAAAATFTNSLTARDAVVQLSSLTDNCHGHIVNWSLVSKNSGACVNSAGSRMATPPPPPHVLSSIVIGGVFSVRWLLNAISAPIT